MAAFRRLSLPVRYSLALVLVGAAVLVRSSLDPVLGRYFPYLFQFLAILLAARYLGFGPGLVAIGGAIALPVYNVVVYSRPRPSNSILYWVTLSVACSVCALLSWLLAHHGQMRSQVEDTSRLAEERLEQLTAEVAHRRREEELSAQLRAVVESSDDAIIAKGLDGKIRSWNYGAEQLFGYTADEAVGQLISLVVPLDRIHEEGGILDRIRAGSRVKHFETIRLHRDGRQIPVSLSISPICDPMGNVTGVSHIARDVTERKQFQDQLLQAQKLESLGVLAGGLAHDFNNLLTGVMGNASLAAQDAGEYSPVLPRLNKILEASERAAVLVRQMLAYAGKGRLMVRSLDLSSEVTEAVPLLRAAISQRVTIDLQLAGALPRIEADAAQMQQLVLNLAINGAEAIAEGTGAGTVTIATYARENGKGSEVVLRVSDTGCGMDDSTSGRIFDPFFTTKFTGRGLGLAAVHGIIRGHHGTISVESAPSRGSIFTVALPAAKAAAGGEAPSLDADLSGEGNVLVVDDEEMVRSMARQALEKWGYRVETAEDGKQAVERFAANPEDFDGILLDLTMPVMDGQETLVRIRAIRRDVPVILSSGFSEVEALQRFEGHGLAGFLQKPYTVSALARKLKQAIGKP